MSGVVELVDKYGNTVIELSDDMPRVFRILDEGGFVDEDGSWEEVAAMRWTRGHKGNDCESLKNVLSSHFNRREVMAENPLPKIN